ncbi:hypothetical protein RugamoR64_41920 [Duganella rhizosphaerae]|uniref:hypothetical protein n=1 Tax=Duganella rhizosphaerae TaxID=2885763 RepID=UPI0030E848AD
MASENDYHPPGHCFAWVTINAPVDGVQTLFSAKIEHPDPDASRTWSIELEVARTADKVVFGLRTSVFGLETAGAPQSIPRLAKHLTDRGACHAALPLSYSGSVITTTEELVKLAAFVNNPDRVIPLIVISELPDGDGWPADIRVIAEETKGIAIAVAMRNELTYRWRELMPPKLNVYGGASRIYLPLNRGYLYAPLLMQREQRTDSDEGIEAWAIRGAVQSSINSPAWIDRHSNFETALRIKAGLQRREAITASRANKDSEALAAMYEEELAALTVQLRQERDESRTWAGEVQQLQDKYQELESTVRSLRYQLEKQASKSQVNDEGSATENCFPETLAEVRSWYENSDVRERLHIAARALRECEKSTYDTPEHIYTALTILANEFYNSKQSSAGPEARRTLDLALNQANLHMEFAGGMSTLKSPDYQLDYDARKLTTEWHLTRGGGRDPRYCMRIYFCWDATTNKCIVGWFPSHLNNTLT